MILGHTMNWAAGLDDVLLGIAEIEGADWLDQEMKLLDGGVGNYHNSVADAVKNLRKMLDNRTADDDDDDGFGPDDMVEIVYGDGGWNRWVFRGTGDVCISTMHCMWESTVDKAIKMGFGTF